MEGRSGIHPLKTNDVQKAVRAQRFQRSAGDPPAIGRIDRIRNGVVPVKSGVRRRRRRNPGSRSKSQRRKGIIAWTSVLLVAVAVVLGVFFWSWLQIRMKVRQTPGASAQADAPLVVHKSSEFPSPPEQDALELVRRGLALREAHVVEKYFRIGSTEPADVVAFLSGMESRDGPVSGLQWLSSVDTNGMLLDGVLVNTEKDGKPQARLALLTPDDKGVWKIDFDAFARTVEPSWGGLLAPDGGRGVLRVLAEPDNYYNGPFSDDRQWVCYEMTSPDTDTFLLGYCRRDTPQARAMLRVVSDTREHEPGRRKRVTVEVRRPDGADARQFEITRVLAQDWVMAAKPFDEAFK